MTRFERTPTPGIYAAIALSMAGVFLIDLVTPLGYAEWVVYLVPVILTLFTWRWQVPLFVAGLTTVRMGVGLMLSPTGVAVQTAAVNRSLGLITVWVVSGVGYQFIRNKLAVRRQHWLQTGETGLNAAMAGTPSLTDLGEHVLRYLAEYLGAHAGALFVREGDGFRRAAGYALPAEGAGPERVQLGDGLVGQAARDGRAFTVSDVPAGYFAIGSGLGQAPPRYLLVAPAAVEGEINTVLELGFTQAVGEADEALVERAGESIAVAVRSAEYRMRLQNLLEETQQQAEELQAQSEELRVQNEELEEQGRALRESQGRLELQQAELEQTNVQLEEQAEVLAAQRDTLERSKANLEQQAHDLEQATRYKSEFLANMSHELRTPLNSSLILAKLLADNREGTLTDEQVTYAQTIHAAGNDLLTLINDILDLSKIEAGRLDIRPESVRVQRIVDSLRRTFDPVAGQKKVPFEVTVAPDVPERLDTDPLRLEQVLKNLLSNAFKFTDTGAVTLAVRRERDGRLAFAVHDTGIGIPAQQLDMIFEAFRQADGTTNRKYGGTGLGLSISRELTRLLGGTLGVTSTAGQGSTFTITIPEQYAGAAPTLPAAPAPTPLRTPRTEVPAPAPPPAPRLRPAPVVEDDRGAVQAGGRVVLVIEDDAAFARILADLAHEFSFQCLVASTAEEGLALAAQFNPSAIVLDVGLPDGSGLGVLDRLKQDVRTRHVPVHVVSAGDYAQTALAMGAAAYMLKPVRRDELAHAFEQMESHLTQTLRRVLIVEDDDVQRSSLQKLLASRDVETVGTATARETLDALARDTYDCMVLDLSLSDASGFDVLETLAQEDQYSFPPVIVYTGRDLSAEEEQRLRRYSRAIIIKGARSPERLLDEVTLFLHQVVAELPAEQQQLLEKARARDAALEGRRILVVEDDVRNVFALSSILEPRGAHVQIARNGREALDALARVASGEAPRVDLVLMDIMMPEMDGLTAMREIRKQDAFKKLPVIALTAKAMKDDQEECLAAGANDYMAKPLDVEQLLSLVRVWMPR